jgi:hypothetical protein
MASVIFFIQFVWLVSGTMAQLANPLVLQGFLDCLKLHNATDYGYYVRDGGYLTIAPMTLVNGTDVSDPTPYIICDSLFGLGFYARYDHGFHTYYDSSLLKDINSVTGEELVALGVITRESDLSTNSGETLRR